MLSRTGAIESANQLDGRDGPPTFAKATAGRPGRPFCTARPAVEPYLRRRSDMRPPTDNCD
jgi:hypothetical protein